MVAITYNYVIVARLFLCGTRHACLRHRRLNEFILSLPPLSSLPTPFFSFARLRGAEKAKGESPSVEISQFFLCTAARVYYGFMKELRVNAERKYLFFFFKGEGKILANNCFPCFFFFNLFDWESFVKRWCVKISMKGRRFIKLWIIEVKTKRRQIIELILSLLNCSWINK